MNSTLRKKLVEICEGRTKSKLAGRTIYFKHLSEYDQIALEETEEKWRAEMIDLGMPSRETRLAEANTAGTWTDSQEDNLNATQKEFNRFFEHKPKFRDVEHIDSWFDTVEVMKGEIEELLRERSAALGQNAEEDAQFEAYNQEIRTAAFADPEFKIPFFDDYDDLDGKTLNDLHVLYYTEISSLRIDGFKTIKKICCQSFFTSKFAICENPFYFLYKPVWQLTHFQAYLIALGSRFLEVMRNCANAPEDYFDEPDKLECYALMVQQKGDDIRNKSQNN